MNVSFYERLPKKSKIYFYNVINLIVFLSEFDSICI